MADTESEVQDIAAESDATLADMDRLIDGKGGEEEEPKPKEDKAAVPPKPTDVSFVTEEEEKEDKETPKPKGDEDEEEEEELDEEFEDETEEEKELRKSSEPTLISEVKAKYPNIFKEFRPLRDAIYRDNQYSQIFVTPQEAAESVQSLEDYKEFETEVLQGEQSKVLKAIRDTDERGYKRFVSGILPALYELDRETYAEVTSPILVGVLRRAKAFGEAQQNTNLINSVGHLAGIIWPELKGEIPNIQARANERDPELDRREQELRDRETRFDQQRAQSFIASIKSVTNNLLRRTVEKGLDPDDSLSPFLKNSVIEKTIKDVQELMDEDPQFGRVMSSLFERAKKTGYRDEFKTRMIGTFLGRAKTLVRPIRKRYLQQAVGVPAKEKEEPRVEKEKSKPPIRKAVGTGTPSGKAGSVKVRSSEIDWHRTSDMDILSGKPILKRK